MPKAYLAACSTMFLSTKIYSVVLLPFLNPDCSLHSLASVTAAVLLIRTLPNTLAAIVTRVMPLQFPQFLRSTFVGSLTTSPLDQSYGTLSSSHIVLNSSCRIATVVSLSDFSRSAVMPSVPGALLLFISVHSKSQPL